MRRVWVVLAALALAACGTPQVGPDDSEPGGKGDDVINKAPGELRAEGVSRVAPPADAPVKPTVAGMTGFGYDLIRAMEEDAKRSGGGKGAGNLVVSPLSVAYAFGMVEAGAGGETKKQLDQVFGFPSGGPHTAFNALTRDVVTTAKPPSKAEGSEGKRGDKGPAAPVVSIANAMFLQHDFSVEKPYLETLAKQYGAGVRTVDFTSDKAAATINQWVDKQTAGRIKKLFDSIDQNMKLVLANAVYMKADWLKQFQEHRTKDETFTKADRSTTKVPMMNQEENLRYFKGSDYAAVELPYAKGDLAMWVLVPEAVGSPTRLLDGKVLGEVGTGLAETRVRVALPKWDYANEIDLKNAMRQYMGVDVPFDPMRADFSGINNDPKYDDLHIMQAIHRANITVDEKGTEAAAVTGVGVGTTSMPPPAKVEVRADKPFAYAVVDKSSSTPLFIGTVNDPRAE